MMIVADGSAMRRSWMAAESTLELPSRMRIDCSGLLGAPVFVRPGNATPNLIEMAAAAVR
jgi:hypothetical protein